VPAPGGFLGSHYLQYEIEGLQLSFDPEAMKPLYFRNIATAGSKARFEFGFCEFEEPVDISAGLLDGPTNSLYSLGPKEKVHFISLASLGMEFPLPWKSWVTGPFTACYTVTAGGGLRRTSDTPNRMWPSSRSEKIQETIELIHKQWLGTGSLRIMFQGEARFGRISDTRRCWWSKPVRPICQAMVMQEYTYAYAAVSAADGCSTP